METGAERPRDVYRDGCAQIAASLTPLGFTYAPSQQRLRRQRGAFREGISFQSSHYNETGVSVALWPHASLYHAGLGSWRRTTGSPLRRDAWLAGAQTGNLAGTGWSTWDLADPRTRDAVIRAVTAEITEVALPWFARIEDTPGLIAEFVESRLHEFRPEGAVEYLAFLGHPDLAEEVIRQAVDNQDRLPPQLHDRLSPLVTHFGLKVELPPSQEQEIAEGAARLLAALDDFSKQRA